MRFQVSFRCLKFRRRAEAEVGDFKIGQHLRFVGFIEVFDDFGVYHNEVIHDEIRDEGVHDLAVINNVEGFLLGKLEFSLGEFDAEGPLIGFFTESRAYHGGDFHRGTDDRAGEVLMKQLRFEVPGDLKRSVGEIIFTHKSSVLSVSSVPFASGCLRCAPAVARQFSGNLTRTGQLRSGIAGGFE